MRHHLLLAGAVICLLTICALSCERPSNPRDYDHLQEPNQPAPPDTFGPHMPTDLELDDLIGKEIVGFSQLLVVGDSFDRQWDLKAIHLDNGLMIELDLRVLPGKGNHTIIEARVLQSTRLNPAQSTCPICQQSCEQDLGVPGWVLCECCGAAYKAN